MLNRRWKRERRLLDVAYRFALALTHRQSEAEDLVQTACMRLLSRYGKLETEAVLFTTIRNLYYDQLRRDKVVAFAPLEIQDEAPGENDRDLGGLEARLDLDSLLSELRAEEREALFLSVVAGYTTREIAEMMERPPNTVASLIHRARRKLSAAASRTRARPGD